MSRLKGISTHELIATNVSRPDPARVLKGNPEFTTAPFYSSHVQSGIWTATPGEHRVSRDEKTHEHFYILEGEIELEEEGSNEVRKFGAGDLVVIEPSFRGIWRTLKPVRKLYFTVHIQ
ncbi:cupin domain-containing protein [Daeguia caeni]|uniref:Cupin domain-containing protein n=1 Tax=Daeguia caeni TaxID=439612 RepID=A0ABV9H9G1_9HYPH